MAHLTLAGRSDDGERLLLVDDRGVEHTLTVDATLRAALRGEHARIGQLEIQMDSALRPRDIQARIRAGETPEAVAQAAQTTVDRVMPYASPVLAERAHVADRAQRSSVRRRSGEPGARTLGEAVAAHLREANVDPGTVEWDAWRREDGRWTLTATFTTPQRTGTATFSFDAPGNYVVADDEAAKWLVGEATEKPRSSGQREPRQRRLSSVATDELPLGDDAIEMISDESPTEPRERSAHGGDTVDLTETAEQIRTDQSPSEQNSEAEAGPGTTPAASSLQSDSPFLASAFQRQNVPGDESTQASAGPDEPEPVPTDGLAGKLVDGASPVDSESVHAAGEVSAGKATDQDANQDEQEQSRRPVNKKRGRASVPSWDEIMFGGSDQDS